MYKQLKINKSTSKNTIVASQLGQKQYSKLKEPEKI
jgi:hypothetical protein